MACDINSYAQLGVTNHDARMPTTLNIVLGVTYYWNYAMLLLFIVIYHFLPTKVKLVVWTL